MRQYTDEENKELDERASRAGRAAAILGIGAVKGIANLMGKSNDMLARAYDPDYDPDNVDDTDKSNPWSRNSVSGAGFLARKAASLKGASTFREAISTAIALRDDDEGYPVRGDEDRDYSHGYGGYDGRDGRGSHGSDCDDELMVVDEDDIYNGDGRYDDDYDDESTGAYIAKTLGRAIFGK